MAPASAAGWAPGPRPRCRQRGQELGRAAGNRGKGPGQRGRGRMQRWGGGVEVPPPSQATLHHGVGRPCLHPSPSPRFPPAPGKPCPARGRLQEGRAHRGDPSIPLRSGRTGRAQERGMCHPLPCLPWEAGPRARGRLRRRRCRGGGRRHGAEARRRQLPHHLHTSCSFPRQRARLQGEEGAGFCAEPRCWGRAGLGDGPQLLPGDAGAGGEGGWRRPQRSRSSSPTRSSWKGESRSRRAAELAGSAVEGTPVLPGKHTCTLSLQVSARGKRDGELATF